MSALDCRTGNAAAVAGILAEAIMAGELSFNDRILPDGVAKRIGATLIDLGTLAGDLAEGLRTTHLMIEARARASVRTPSHAALSAAEAALALAEDALSRTLDVDVDDWLLDLGTLASIADVLRAGLRPLHAAERGAAATNGPAAA